MTTATKKQARMLAARQALAAAEASVGVRARVASMGPHTAGGAAQAADGASDGLGGNAAGGNAGGNAAGLETVGQDGFAVPPLLEELLPGGLRRGTIAEVRGSTSVLLALAEAAAGEERWCVLVGMPDVGWAAAAAVGLDLHRVVAVPQPGPEAAEVLGALVDGFDVVLVGPCPQLRPAARRSLGARLRQRGAVLLTDQSWPGAHLTLQARSVGWRGVGHGHGLLTGQEMLIQRMGRGHLGGPAHQVRLLVGPHGLATLPGQQAQTVESGAQQVAEPGRSTTAEHQPATAPQLVETLAGAQPAGNPHPEAAQTGWADEAPELAEVS
ncbi:MAG TPA: hypothetical protein VK063_10360 [Beutenbergiaceae bacterium]|nr:hypothetical protein [Beutenbergiaceae bacterium]